MMSSTFSDNETAPFFDFLDVVVALVFSYNFFFLDLPLLSFHSHDPYLYLSLFSPVLFYFFTGMGAAYSTTKSGVGIVSMGMMRLKLVMKLIVPVVMAGVLGIYGLIIIVTISTGINPKGKSYYLFDGYAHLSSGLAGLSVGMAIGIVSDARVWPPIERLSQLDFSSF
ncbi:V-type proton ATPase 16 kDa proteolipid subunit-like [Magnolia sinica]|uniref:V-type proton ATPase 16 kDa proteolipid subunit-like n=1 Tax=Magnolia sinica TaxID=86752 RepID=UPI002658E483|nr:V-type proton ATPase 16 kDa proteolipid subunit-like [Magnolia sinica]